MKKILLSFCFLFLFMSCASMGTYQKLSNKEALISTKKIGVIPYLFYGIDESEKDSLIKICDNELIKRLKDVMVYEQVTKVINDSLFLDKYSDKELSGIYDYAKERQFDALLFCTIEVSKKSYMFIPYADVKSKLSLIRVEDQKEIIDILFDTHMGKSYVMPPNVEDATKDAVEGSVDVLLSSINKNNTK